MEIPDSEFSDIVTANKFRNVYAKSILDGKALFTYDSGTKTGHYTGLVTRGDRNVHVELNPTDKTEINILLNAQRQRDAQQK
jgi:hypothetical protein